LKLKLSILSKVLDISSKIQDFF